MKSLFSIFEYIIRPFQFKSQTEFTPPTIGVLNDNSGNTKFYLNDPTTPSLMGEKAPPNETCFPMDVKDDLGPGYTLGSPQQQASACKLVIDSILSYFLVVHKLTKTDKRLNGWVRKRPLVVLPRAGVDLNAFYDRSSLKFFYYNAPNKIVFACDSTQVVCHEFGHAFLDILRPDLWSTQSFESWAYHESFGDISSILFALQNDDLIKEAIEETKGNLLKSNVITRMGAEMGKAYYDMLKDKKGVSPSSLRDLSVVYKYVDPRTLPKKGRDDTLICESHNFSRVFTGAFYEMCIRIAEQIMKDGICKDLTEAMKLSRDVCARYLLSATESAPLTVRLFEAVAKHILLADKIEGGKYQKTIKSVFLNRAIIKNDMLMLSNKSLKDVKAQLSKSSYTLNTFGQEKVITTSFTKAIKVLDKKLVGMNNNPLYNLKVEIASQESYVFDNNNNLIDFMGSTEDEAVDSAIHCLEYLNSNNLVGKGKDSIFEVRYGKVVRKKISCKCGLPNYCDPNAPEYNKPWKPANHFSYGECVGDKCLPRSCECTQIEVKQPKKTFCSTGINYCIKSRYSVGQFLKRKFCSN